jgi:hypothetical protein
VLARVALAEGHAAEAAEHVATARSQIPPHAATYDRLEIEIVGARVAAAQGRHDEAARAFAAVLAETDRRGLVDLGLFARRERDESELRHGDAAAARAALAALEHDATARGFLHIARRAAALRAAPR